MDKIETLFRTVDGTYVDLSRIVAILPVKKIPADFFGFDILFLDQTFSITIQKQYDKPLVLREHLSKTHAFGYDEEGQKIFRQFLESSEKDMEANRTELYKAWLLTKS